jgi:uncharacterized protein (DUF1501 family)
MNNESILANVSSRDRRTLAIRFLRSDETMVSLLRKCKGDTDEAQESKKVLACVLLMTKEDAPEDLLMTDSALYQRLRKRITDIRMAGWSTR